jgi:hypothetical protein
LGAKFKAKTIWNGVLEKMKKKTCGLEENVLIKGGPSYLDKKYSLEPANIFYVSFPHSGSGGLSYGKIAIGFFMGRYGR